MKVFVSLSFIFGIISFLNAENSRPNILLITVDNLGYGDLACYNPETTIKAPNLDRLASQGARLTQFYTASPTCTVSRACLMTGRIPQRHGLDYQLPGVKGNYGIGLSQAEILIPEILKTAPVPFATGCIGKWNIGFAKGSRPTERGFDEFLGNASGNMDYYRHNYNDRHDLYKGTRKLDRKGEYATDILAEAAREFISRRSEDEAPWFCYLPFNAPHFPSKGNKREGEPNIWQAPDWAFQETGMSPDEPDPKKRYDAVVYALDKRIGEVLDALEKTGESSNTFVFFMSDNGAFRLNRKGIDVGSNYPLRSGGVTCWEGGLRVAAMARWPGTIEPGSVISEVLWSPDLFVACAELAEAVIPERLVLDGKNPFPVLTEGAKSPHNSFFFKYRKHEALRQGDWKIVRENSQKPWQLYHLADDSSETQNLAEAKSEQCDELVTEFLRWQDSMAGHEGKLKPLNMQNFSIIRQDKEDWIANGDTLTLRTQPGRIWSGDGSENILTTPAIWDSPKVLSACVELRNPSIKFEQAGLVCYVNDNHFIKFVVEHIDGKFWVVSGMETPNGEKKRNLLSKSPLSRMSAELSMEINGDMISCRYRENDDLPWKIASTGDIPLNSSRSVGFFTQDGPENQSNLAMFSRIKIGPVE